MAVKGILLHCSCYTVTGTLFTLILLLLYKQSPKFYPDSCLIWCTVKFWYLCMPCYVIHIMSYYVIKESESAHTQDWPMHKFRAFRGGLRVRVTWLWTAERHLLLKLSRKYMAKELEGSTWTSSRSPWQ